MYFLVTFHNYLSIYITYFDFQVCIIIPNLYNTMAKYNSVFTIRITT